MGGNELAQTTALFHKNLAIQRRACKTNCCLISFPLLICTLLGVAQTQVNRFYYQLKDAIPEAGCGGYCAAKTTVGSGAGAVGGLICPSQCPLPLAPRWPPLVQLSAAEDDQDLAGLSAGDGAGAGDSLFSPPAANLPAGVAAAPAAPPKRYPPTTFLYTGSNKSFAQSVMSNMFQAPLKNSSGDASSLPDFALGTHTAPVAQPGITDEFGTPLDDPLYFLQSKCTPDSKLSFPVQLGTENRTKEAHCTEGLFLWRESLSGINNELYNWGKSANKIDEIASVYDLTSSDLNKFNSIVSYNSTYKGDNQNPASTFSVAPAGVLVPRLLNMVSNAYLKLRGKDTKMQIEFVKVMPRAAEPQVPPDVSFLVGKLVFVWIIMLIFPVILSNIVYEKQQRLRIMMRMHGLGNLAYWTISYCYFLVLSLLYMLSLVAFGSYIGVKLFQLTDYGLQFMILTGYLYVMGSGFLGEYFFKPFVEDITLSRGWVILLEFFAPFSLYRIIYEFTPPATLFSYSDFSGLHWRDLSDLENGMLEVLIIMVFEWIMFLFLTFYLDEFGSLRNGIRKMTSSQAAQQQSIQLHESKASSETGRSDILRERELVEKILKESNSNYSVICDNIKKVYRGQDGNAEKFAVRGLSLAMQRGQCFGILGPNGAGKTSLISMNCLLWEILTAREHLMFYGRLKKLKGAALAEAIKQSLESVRLLDVADKHVSEYSGGMKRRLSVAISLIGSPKVVYMDEPSSGLDPSSRKALWNAVLSSKQNKVIILTTHSMEEAEALCDRIGIVANGALQCIGSSHELKAKYGGTYVLGITTAVGEEAEVEKLVRSISPSMKRTYHIAGTQKFEMPKQGVKISNVFQAMEHAKTYLNIIAWGLSDTTLEDVFIKVAKAASDMSSM
ncbi:hypothetical protein ACP4OV_009914 [Aristida adscensionis]